jgi:hypothetical protein
MAVNQKKCQNWFSITHVHGLTFIFFFPVFPKAVISWSFLSPFFVGHSPVVLCPQKGALAACRKRLANIARTQTVGDFKVVAEWLQDRYMEMLLSW